MDNDLGDLELDLINSGSKGHVVIVNMIVITCHQSSETSIQYLHTISILIGHDSDHRSLKQ